MHNNWSIGRAGEAHAANYLAALGWLIIARNYRCRIGEIDLIGFDSGTVVFCEVKTRTTESFGGAATAVSEAKYRRLTRLADYFCAVSLRQLLPPTVCIREISYRLDLVAIDIDRSGIPHVQHIRAI